MSTPTTDVLASVPADLKRRPQWVVWRLEKRGDDKPTKIPYDAKTARHAKSSDLATWSTFDAAVTASQSGRYSGVGFVFCEADPFCGIDLDNCRDPQTGKFAPWADEALYDLDSYSEVSPSHTGVKVFVRASLRHRV